MSDTAAAIRAAREVQAPSLSPLLYGRARDYWERSKRAYKFKDFQEAQFYAIRARKLAEEAEFESVCCRGGQRQDINLKDPLDEETEAESSSVAPVTDDPEAGLLDDQPGSASSEDAVQ